MPRRQAENTEKKNQKERRVMSQKERVDLIEVDLLDMCKYILSKWVFIMHWKDLFLWLELRYSGCAMNCG